VVGKAPVLLLVLGLIGGAGLTAFSAWMLVIGARRRRLAAQERLTEAVRSVVDALVMAPIRAVLDQHRLTREALAGRHAEPVAVSRAARAPEALTPAVVPGPSAAVPDGGWVPPVSADQQSSAGRAASSLSSSPVGGSAYGVSDHGGAKTKIMAPTVPRAPGTGGPTEGGPAGVSRTLTV
jgi:hypothetical protein